MGFDTQNFDRSSVEYLSIGTTQDDKKVITNRFFQVTRKNEATGKYDKIPQLVSDKYPAPFFGYLKEIKVNLENKMKIQGKDTVIPKISFQFIDDENKRFVLDSSLFTEVGRINSNMLTLLNSLASIEQFGYLKLYFTKTQRKDAEGVFNFTLNVRNAINWNPELDKQVNYKRFLTPKDPSITDETRVKWLYEYSQIPPLEVEEEVKGRKVKIVNIEEHQKFFLDIINGINEKIKDAQYNVTTPQPKATPTTTAPATTTRTPVAQQTAVVSVVDESDVDESFTQDDDNTDDLPF